MRRLALIAGGLLLGAILPLSARTFSFPEQNFQCEMPDSWTVIKATGSDVSAQSPDGRVSFEVMTGLLTDGLTIESDEFHESIRALFTRQGYLMKGPTYVELQGRRFAFWQLVPPDPNPFNKPIAWAWVIIADGRLYILKPTCDEDPATNAEISGIANSFQFIATPQIPDNGSGWVNLASTPTGDGEVHRMISPLIIIGVVVCVFAGPAIAIGLVIFFIRRHERKRYSGR